MSKVRQITHFELVRNLKKPSFWIAAIMVPVFLVAYVMIVGFTSYTAGENLSAGTDTTNLKLGLYDEANYVKKYSFINSNQDEQTVAKYESRDNAMAALEAGEVNVLYILPESFTADAKVEVHVKNGEASLFDNYTVPIAQLLQTEAITQVTPINYAIIAGAISYDTTNYDNEGNTINLEDTISRMAAPIIAAILFYLIIVLLGNRLTVALVEEKENRISELLLTSVKPIHLIIGKTISLMILGIIQMIVILLPTFIIYLIAKQYNLLPEINLSFDVASIVSSAILLLTSYFTFTALSLLVGSLSSTARDANNYAGVLIIMMILPVIFLNAYTGDSVSTLGYVLTYFPPSAPISLMIRSIMGNLPTWELVLGCAEIFIIGVAVLRLAAYIFCRNVISFTAKVDFKKLLGAPRKVWKK